MTITETKQAVGSWAITLRPDTPRHILDGLTYFGHIVVHAGRANVQELKDNMLASARYVGVFRARSAANQYTLRGGGMALWLGDEDDKGDVHETAVVLTAQTFANSVTALLPPSGSITAGTIYSVAGTYNGRHQWETPRKAITYVTDTFSSPSVPVEWRVNNNGTLDAGPVANLFVTTPKVMITRNQRPGRDLSRVVFPGSAGLSKDVDDYTTRVVLLAEGEGSTIQTGAASAVGVPFKDIHGNTAKFTRLVSESDTSATNANTRAQLMLNRFSSARTDVELSTSAYDVRGEARVGDYLDVYDPDNGFIDPTREVPWNGQLVHPVALRCIEMTWPVTVDYTVAFRDANGVYIDLTPWFLPEAGDTTIVVGELAASLSGVGSQPVGSRPSVDTSTPATPAWVTPFGDVAYQSSAANDIRAAVLLGWTEPLNVDGSTILDGSHYEIRYRTTQVYNYAVTWAQLCGFSDALLEPFDHTIASAWGNGWTIDNGPATDYNVAGGVATIYLSAQNSGRNTYKSTSVLNGKMIADVKNDKISVGANAYIALTFRRHDTNDTYYMAQLRFRTDGFVGVRFTRRLNGSETTLLEDQLIWDAANPGGVPHNIADWYRIEATWQSVDATNTLLKMRAYRRDDPAPDWNIEYTDNNAGMVFSGRNGFRAFRGGTADSTMSFDNVEVTAWGTGYTWDQAQTWGRPITPPVASGEWQYAQTGWDNNQFLVQELTVAADYEFQIRAVDSANPPNASAWGSSEFVTTSTDLIPPDQPAPPEVAASRIAIQVLHRLGVNTGGEYNLPPDLHHLEVHVGGSDAFQPSEGTLIGSLSANESNIVGNIPALGTFPVEETAQIWIKVVAVDRFGNKSSPSEAVTVTAELIDSAHISDLTASKITAGTITTNLILAGTIKTAESGQRAELNGLGLQLFDENGELTVNITADDSQPNFFAVTDGPENTLASIDQDGNINGQTVNAAQAIVLAGDDLQTDIIDPLPRGVVAYGSWSSAQQGGANFDAAGAGTTNETPFMELSFVAEAGRRYQVLCTAQTVGSTADEEVAFQLRDGGTSAPTVSSPRLSRAEIALSAEIFASDLHLIYTGEFTAGLHRLLWTFFGYDNIARIHLNNHPAVMTISDVGSSLLVGDTAVVYDAPSPPPITTYTKSYNCNWYGSYTGSGSQKTDATTANQGQYSSTHGNQRSLLGFPYATIMSDLSGATITKCEVTLYAEHWYYNAGGTAVIGTHGYTSKPSTWSDGSVNQNRLTSAGWPKPGKRTVNLGTTIGNDFKSGAAKGIALGPGNNTSWDYYGKFTPNTGSTSSNRPVLKITYQK